jgi:hypothetical protein
VLFPLSFFRLDLSPVHRTGLVDSDVKVLTFSQSEMLIWTCDRANLSAASSTAFKSKGHDHSPRSLSVGFSVPGKGMF